jgi:hypothetical protein
MFSVYRKTGPQWWEHWGSTTDRGYADRTADAAYGQGACTVAIVELPYGTPQRKVQRLPGRIVHQSQESQL